MMGRFGWKCCRLRRTLVAGKSILVGDASIRHGESTTMGMARDGCN